MLFFLVVLISLFPHLLSALRPKTCEEMLPNSFTRDQRSHFCKNSLGSVSTHCANEAKSVLKLKYDDIFALCQYSDSPTTVDCLQELSLKDRSAVGANLCAAATSTIPAVCYKSILAMKTVKQFDTSDIVAFCSDIEDDSPITCLSVALAHHIPPLVALEHCPYVVNTSVTASCLNALTPHVSPSRGVAADAIMEFCAAQAATNASDCYLSSAASNLSPSQKLQLCSSTTSTVGPTSCLSKILPSKLPLSDALSLCQGASNTGPALCYTNLPPGTSAVTRLKLCSGASGVGPAQCYRRGSSSTLDDETKILLCSSSSSDGPMSCYLAAPLALSVEEKLLLCQDASPQRYKEPVDCFAHVTSFAKKFKGAPSKSLSSPNLSPSEQASKQLLLTLCSPTITSQPLYGAHCLQNTPTSIPLNDAIIACYNSSGDSEVIPGLCESLLPRKYPAILCSGDPSRESIQSRIACVSTLLDRKFNMTVATSLCLENAAIAECLSSASSSSEMALNVCRDSPSPVTGKCVRDFLSSKMQFQSDALQLLCATPPPSTTLPCLRSLHRRTVITAADASTCLTIVPTVASLKILRVVGIHNSPFINATKPFSLYISLFDQFGSPAVLSAAVRVRVSIASNEQGAVLWGQSYNTSTSPAIELHNLAISQPGAVEMKLVVEEEGSVFATYVTQVLVQADTSTPPSQHCLFVFASTVCDTSSAEEIGNSVRLEGRIPLRYLYSVLSCSEVYSSWGVGVEVSSGGVMVANYRSGVDAIWTGVGLPQSDQDFFTRLEIDSSSTSREIRRAYYRKSLIWHPDRWAGFGRYTQVVQGAFELIAEAYMGLSNSSTVE